MNGGRGGGRAIWLQWVCWWWLRGGSMGVATGGRGDTLYKVGERKAKLARRTIRTKARRTSKEGSDVGVECA